MRKLTPPPLPPAPIECIRFDASGTGIHTGGFDRKRLDSAQAAAKEWLATQSQIEIISIDSCFGNVLAFVTVWYRRKS